MRITHSTGQLFLEDHHVGDVAISGWQGAWGFGEFAPNPEFEPFAPMFSEWSKLMHADAASEPLSRLVADRLRKAEYEMYAVHAKLFIPDMRQWREVAILNIDGPMIEWKERRAADPARTPENQRAHDFFQQH